MKKYVCDQCGKEIRGSVGYIVPGILCSTEGTEPDDREQLPELDNVHFHMKCLRTVMNRFIQPQKEPDDTGEPAGDGKDAPAKQRVKLDVGKVMALHRAGWSNKMIAEEMHATENQIYKCIYYQKNYKKETGDDSNEE
jgi:hypothetical protein